MDHPGVTGDVFRIAEAKSGIVKRFGPSIGFLDQRGDVYVDGRPVRPWMVQNRVREQLQGGEERPVLVITDRRVRAEQLLEVVDQCRLAGAKDVAVATDREAG